MIVDIKRAYFYAPAQKPIYVRLPPEDPRAGDPTICGRLRKSLYGTRDAGSNWHAAYSGFLRDIGFQQGSANPCHFINRSVSIKGVVHGDDFLFVGSRKSLQDLQKKFQDQYECKVELIGPEPDMPKSARFLNRVVSYTKDAIEFEGDHS